MVHESRNSATLALLTIRFSPTPAEKASARQLKSEENAYQMKPELSFGIKKYDFTPISPSCAVGWGLFLQET